MTESKTQNQSWFARATNWLIARETDAVKLIATFLPWLVPAVPATLIFYHASDPEGMNYGPGLSWIMAIVSEGLGLASLVVTFIFWAHNRKYKDEKNHVPIQVPIFTYIFYLAIVMSINVILDWQRGVDPIKVIVVALFSLLSVPAGLLLAVQTLYNEKLEELESARTQAAVTRAANKTKEQPEPEPVKVPLRKQVFDFIIKTARLPSELTAKDIADAMGVPEKDEKTRSNIRKYFNQAVDLEEAGQWQLV